MTSFLVYVLSLSQPKILQLLQPSGVLSFLTSITSLYFLSCLFDCIIDLRMRMYLFAAAPH